MSKKEKLSCWEKVVCDCGETSLKPLTREVLRSDDEYGDFFNVEDVLSALGLLNMKLKNLLMKRPNINIPISIEWRKYNDGIKDSMKEIKKCFQIQGQGSAKLKSMAEIKAGGLRVVSSQERKTLNLSGKSSSNVGGNTCETSSQDYPAQLKIKEGKE